MSEEEISRPSFSGPLKAAWRQGLKELAQYLPAFPDNPRPIEEPGTMGNPTTVMVTEQLRNEPDQGHEKVNNYEQLLDRYASREPIHDEPEQEIER